MFTLAAAGGGIKIPRLYPPAFNFNTFFSIAQFLRNVNQILTKFIENDML